MALDDRTESDIEGYLAGIRRRHSGTWLDQLTEGYELCARAEGKSPRTIELVLSAVGYLAEFLATNGLPADVRQIGCGELRRFIVALQERPRYASHPITPQQETRLSGHTVNAYARGLQSFWAWLRREDLVEANPFDHMKIPKPPKKIPPIFTDDQLRDLLGVIDVKTATGFRDHVMLSMLLDTGMRVSEMTGLDIADVNLESRLVKVWGKGSKERMVPIGARLVKLLWKYNHAYRPEPMFPRQDRLFLTRNGRPLGRDRVEAVMERYGRKAGIAGVRCSPHTLRHTFAVFYLRNGGDVFSLQRIMGHSTLEILKRYINLAQDDMSRVHRMCSPLDNLDPKRPRKRQ